MEFLIWVGAAISLAGLAGIIWCIVAVWNAKRTHQNEDELRNNVRKLIPINAAALFLSVIGLMLVVIGVLFSA